MAARSVMDLGSWVQLLVCTIFFAFEFSMYCPKITWLVNCTHSVVGSTPGPGPGFLGSIPSVYYIFASEFSINCPKITLSMVINCPKIRKHSRSTHGLVAERWGTHGESFFHPCVWYPLFVAWLYSPPAYSVSACLRCVDFWWPFGTSVKCCANCYDTSLYYLMLVWVGTHFFEHQSPPLLLYGARHSYLTRKNWGTLLSGVYFFPVYTRSTKYLLLGPLRAGALLLS
jgi:hypothetical protein